MKRGFRDASRARGGSRGCRGIIDLHYAKITPHAVNLVCRAGMRVIPTADVDDTDTRAGIATISSRALKIIKANLTTPLRRVLVKRIVREAVLTTRDRLISADARSFGVKLNLLPG